MTTYEPKPKLHTIPPALACLQDYENMAEEFMSAAAWAYIQGGSGDELTLRENREAFTRVHILPTLLQNLEQGSTVQTLGSHTLRHPIVLAPVAYQKLVHDNGELETAYAAEATDTLMVSSTLSSFKMESITECNQGQNWFQLYIQAQEQTTEDLIRRAEAAGYSALMVTLDTPIQCANRRLMRLGGSLPAHIRAENLVPYSLPEPANLNPNESPVFQGAMTLAPDWKTLERLSSSTKLPIWVKGVLNPQDAEKLKQLGIEGLVVSNHGGRAFDGSPATLNCIGQIRATVGDDFPLIMDGGVRSGYDVFKAIAMGANAVMLGRPQMHGLAIAGALGVGHILKLLRDELEVAMALAGCKDLAAIRASRCVTVRNF